jgi:hypothetical protein
MASFHATFERPYDIPAYSDAGLYADHGLPSFGLEKGVGNRLCEAPEGPSRQTVPDTFFVPDARRATIVRWLVGLVLIGAAILKAVQLITEPTIALTTGRMMLPLQIGAELGVGLLAVTGLYWRHLRWFAAILFTTFAAYSLYSATRGAASCGCFGPLDIHPWWTFALDVAILLGLLLPSRLLTPLTPRPDPVRDRERERASPSLAAPRYLASAIAALSALTTAFLVQYTSGKSAAAAGILTTTSGLVILEPEQWIGKVLPIRKFIDLDLSDGNWIVLLHRHDCPACQEALPKYEHLARSLLSTPLLHSSSTPLRIALIEIPPYAPRPVPVRDRERNLDTDLDRPTNSAAHHGRLSADHEWFVETPTEITLQGGIVTAVNNPGHDTPRPVPVRDRERSFDPASRANVPVPSDHHAHGLPAFP